MSTKRSPRRTPWPAFPRGADETGLPVAVVVANFNTCRLIAQLVFSLYRLLGRDQFSRIVVVDNASTDGSRELLAALKRAELIQLIQNRTQRYHGPALTQAISSLARGQRSLASPGIDYVWVLDSDVVVLRRDTVRDALALFDRPDVAAVGQPVGDPAYDKLLRYNPQMLHPSSLLLDPRRVWRSPIPPLVEDGAPATALQVAADAHGLRLVAFPFVEEGYLIHLGRATLREIAGADDASNRYYAWALDHRDPHFAGREDAERLYRGFCDLFDTEVGVLTPDNVVGACVRPRRRSIA